MLRPSPIPLVLLLAVGSVPTIAHAERQKATGRCPLPALNLPREPLWTRGGQPTPQAVALAEQLRNAEQLGLSSADYEAAQWASQLSSLRADPSAEQIARFDLAFSAVVFRFVADLHGGRVNPHDLGLGLSVDRTLPQIGELVRQLATADDVDGVLRAVQPTFPVYQRTLSALRTYLAMPQDLAELPPVRSGHAVKPGQPYAAGGTLAERLTLLGDLDARAPLPLDGTYAGPIVSGVQHFQRRHGLDATGDLDAAAIRQLNVPIQQRVAQLALSLERLRWLPHDLPAPPLVVNIPEFRLHVDDGAFHWLFSMPVVIGQTWHHHQTPIFMGKMESIVFHPYWEVPRDIAATEIVPQLERNPATLAKNQYEIVDKRGAVIDGPADDPTTLGEIRNGTLRVRQKPGPGNALGAVKFVFPNQYSVYLHGTPATRLFELSRRDFSHGCIRVEDPERLAEWVLKDDPSWPADRIREAVEGTATVRVELIKPVPVLVLYSTAVVTEDGEVHFFEDLYGLDRRLLRALAQRGHGECSAPWVTAQLP